MEDLFSASWLSVRRMLVDRISSPAMMETEASSCGTSTGLSATTPSPSVFLPRNFSRRRWTWIPCTTSWLLPTLSHQQEEASLRTAGLSSPSTSTLKPPSPPLAACVSSRSFTPSSAARCGETLPWTPTQTLRSGRCTYTACRPRRFNSITSDPTSAACCPPTGAPRVSSQASPLKPPRKRRALPRMSPSSPTLWLLLLSRQSPRAMVRTRSARTLPPS
mmetsp:Transcript_29141/g.93707  ORF Transcript_29141/g.93707 Transcript_29141/m.93707 type:complete len:219 (+) Transcript_29141:1041-1697(+)